MDINNLMKFVSFRENKKYNKYVLRYFFYLRGFYSKAASLSKNF